MYHIFMHPDLVNFTFSGSIHMELQVLTATDFVVFHSKELDIQSVSLSLTGKKMREVAIVDRMTSVAFEQVYLKLSEELPAGSTVDLNISFSGKLNDNMYGFYRSSYKTKTGDRRWLATTHFEPTDARAAFPCFDEPHLKANFTFSIVRPVDYISLFNSEKISEEELKDEGGSATGMIDRFATTVKMSTYLVAFVVCDFEASSKLTKTNVKVSVYTPHEMIPDTELALDSAVKILDFLEDFYGVKYPFNKSDHVGIPDLSVGAMENWGLVTYLMRYLVFDEEESSERDKQWVVVIVAHELAHQWFGNLVTMKWWNDLWLNEGFARFVEHVATDKIKPDWLMMESFSDDTLNPALRSDILPSSHPISVPVVDPLEIGEIFDTISYEKGAAVIRMLERVVGADIFNKALRSYLIRHQYANAETDDLWKSFTSEMKNTKMEIDVKEMMDTWTLQMGFPLVTITRSGRNVTVTQERFMFKTLADPNYKSDFEDSRNYTSPFGYKWYIPLTYVTNFRPNNASLVLINKQDRISFLLESDVVWIKANHNTSGVYRVHYDEAGWEAIIRQLKHDHTVFTPADRANLLSDAFELARSGHLNITTALDMSTYLVNETSYNPWNIMKDCLDEVIDLFDGHPQHALLRNYLEKLATPVLNSLGWEDTGDHVTKLMRSYLLGLAVNQGFKEYVVRAREEFRGWMKSGKKLSPNLKFLVLMGGVKYGGEEEWQFVWDEVIRTNNPSQRMKLLQALAASTDIVKINRLLEASLNESFVRISECPGVLSAVGMQSSGQILLWRFVRNNWDLIFSRYHSVVLRLKRVIESSSSHFSTEQEYEDVKEFFQKKLQQENLRVVSQALDSIKMNIDWRRRNEQMLIDWLKSQAF